MVWNRAVRLRPTGPGPRGLVTQPKTSGARGQARVPVCGKQTSAAEDTSVAEAAQSRAGRQPVRGA
ncbi:hypothetical protein GCM10009635_56790 [Actinocatenispora thailandica]